MTFFDNFFFGVYPYIALGVFFLGSLIRYDREQFTWRTESSQILRRRELVWGSNLFHIGILFLFFGHFFGLLIPHHIYGAFGLTVPAKQMLAILSGGLAGIVCLAGLIVLLRRRVADPRIRKNSRPMDFILVILILFILLLGLSGIVTSLQHPQGGIMLQWAEWAQGVWTFSPALAEHVEGIPMIYKIHVIAGMTLFLIFPFSRLVHVWSGFAALSYLWRSYQVVRRRGNPRKPLRPIS